MAKKAPKRTEIFNLKIPQVLPHIQQILSYRNSNGTAPRVHHVCMGTKGGKTMNFGIDLTLEGFNGAFPRRRIWWIAPEYEMCDIMIDDVFLNRIYPMHTTEWERQLKPYVKLSNQKPRSLFFRTTGTKVEFQSAKEAPTKVGRALNKVYLDEISLNKPEILYNVMTMTGQTRGQVFCFSWPRGKDWWWNEWKKGWDGDELYPADPVLRRKHKNTHKSWRFPSTISKFVTQEMIDDWKSTLPEHIYRELVLAEWMEAGGRVFQNIDKVCILEPGLHDRPEAGHKYLIGYDPAQTRDINAYGVWDISVFPFEERVLGEFPRGQPWELCWNQLAELSRFWLNAPIVYDNTGGSFKYGHMEQLQARGIQAIPFEFAGLNRKNNAINIASLLFETLGVRLTTHAKARLEVEAYTYSKTKLNNITYHAPEGMTDDYLTVRVMIANHAVLMNPEKKNMVCDIIENRRKTLQEIENEQLFKFIDDLTEATKHMNREDVLIMLAMQGFADPERQLAVLEKARLEG